MLRIVSFTKILQVRDQLLNAFLVAFRYQSAFAQVALRFGGLVSEQVAGESVVTLQFSGTGLFETLRCAFMGFHFRHGIKSSCLNYLFSGCSKSPGNIAVEFLRRVCHSAAHVENYAPLLVTAAP
jgi:hypothetical protein